jgi:general secretion pathway protein G
MRRAIDQYQTDKGKLPKSIDDLVEGKYLRERPIDPIVETTDWEEEQGPDPTSSEGEEGLVNVKSKAEGADSDGKEYADY